MPAKVESKKRSSLVTVACVALVMLVAGTSGQQGTAAAQAAPAANVPNPKGVATPFVKQHIYVEDAKPAEDIAAALKQARREHKRVLLDFGGDWCGDCQVLDLYFHQAPNADLLAKNFVLVHVFIGRMDRNLEIAEKYGVPVKKGVPALAVLTANGKPVYSQQTGEFRDMRYMNAKSVTEFLEAWKPRA